MTLAEAKPKTMVCDGCDLIQSSDTAQDGQRHKGCQASPKGRLRRRDVVSGGAKWPKS